MHEPDAKCEIRAKSTGRDCESPAKGFYNPNQGKGKIFLCGVHLKYFASRGRKVWRGFER